MKRVLLFLMCGLPMSGFSAGWSERYSVDDGGRLYVSAKVGAVNTRAIDMSNDLGYTSNPYYILYDADAGQTEIVSELDRFLNYAGWGEIPGEQPFVNIGKLKPHKKLDTYSFYSSLALGFVVPEHPNWRGEFSWDHVSETSYDTNPLFEGTYVTSLNVSGGANLVNYADGGNNTIVLGSGVSAPAGGILEDNREYDIFTGAVSSDLKIDLYMFNMYYDFFSGIAKPVKTWVPYIGLGFGYANIITTMQLVDEYGDLSFLQSLAQYSPSELQGPTYNVTGKGNMNWLGFDKSEKQKGSLAASAMIGASYGITKNAYLDFGAKVSWVDKIQWALTADDLGSKDIFSAKNNLLTSLSVGFRFEF